MKSCFDYNVLLSDCLCFNLICRSAIVPLALCFGLATIFGCGLVFAAGVIYGLMGLGKK